MVHTSRLLNELRQALVPPHSLIKRAKEVLVELLLGVLVEHVVLLQQGFLRADLGQSRLHARRSYTFAFVATTVRWGHCFNLLNDRLPWIDLVNNSEETGKFGPMPWQGFQLLYQVISSLVSQQGKLVNIIPVAFLCQLKRVLLQVERPQQLINGERGQVFLVDLDVLAPAKACLTGATH